MDNVAGRAVYGMCRMGAGVRGRRAGHPVDQWTCGRERGGFGYEAPYLHGDPVTGGIKHCELADLLDWHGDCEYHI